MSAGLKAFSILLCIGAFAYAKSSRERPRDMVTLEKMNYCTSNDDCEMVELQCDVIAINKAELPAYKEIDKRFGHSCRVHQKCASVQCLEHRCIPRDCGTLDQTSSR